MSVFFIAVGVLAVVWIGWTAWRLVRRDLDGIALADAVLTIVFLVLLSGLAMLTTLVPIWVSWVVVAVAAGGAAVGSLRYAGVLPATGRPGTRPRPDGRPRGRAGAIVALAVTAALVLATLALTLVAGR